MHSSSSPRYLLGLVGSGIADSLTPPMHEREADRAGLRCLYLAIDIDRLEPRDRDLGGVIRYARLLGFRGLNITHPCKQAVLEHLDEVSPGAAAIGAVNTVLFDSGRGIGHNTDVYGFEQNFVRRLPGAPVDKVVLLGAGGAGSAAAHALLGLGARRLVVVDPDERRLRRLEASLGERFGQSRAGVVDPSDVKRELAEASGVVNATPIGMAAHPGMPLSAACLHPGLWVADLVYLPLRTELLTAARRAGCRTLDGGGMAVFQAARAFELFTGIRPDTGRMLRHFQELAAAR